MRDNEAKPSLSAAISNAKMRVSPIRPNGKMINMYPVINFEDAPEEMKNDDSIVWIEDHEFHKTFTFRSLTEEEKEEIRLNEIYKLEHMFKFILKHYGWKYAKEFYELDQWRKKFDKYGIDPNLNISHCKYEKNHLYDLECPFFKDYCTYKEKK